MAAVQGKEICYAPKRAIVCEAKPFPEKRMLRQATSKLVTEGFPRLLDDLTQ
jgi:hypothetical protein